MNVATASRTTCPETLRAQIQLDLPVDWRVLDDSRTATS
jgi:hypothetical protein